MIRRLAAGLLLPATLTALLAGCQPTSGAPILLNNPCRTMDCHHDVPGPPAPAPPAGGPVAGTSCTPDNQNTLPPGLNGLVCRWGTWQQP